MNYTSTCLRELQVYGKRVVESHACCKVEVLVRGAAPVPLRCPAVNCGTQHPRRDVLEATVQADPGLRSQASRVGGATASLGEELLSRGPCYECGQNSRGIATTRRHSMLFPWMTWGNVPKPRKKRSRSWQAHTRA